MPGSLRILYASDVFPDPNSGAAGTDLQTINSLGDCGHQVDCLWQADFKHSISHPALHAVFELPTSMRKSIVRALDVAKYDVVIANQPFAYLAAKANRESGREVTFVIRSHGFESNMEEVLSFWRNKLGVRARSLVKAPIGNFLDHRVRRACGYAANYSDGILVNSQQDRQYIIETYRKEPSSVACVPQAAPEAFLNSDLKPFSANRLEKLLFIGPPQFYKGIDILVPAISDLLSEHQSLEFVWVCGAADIEQVGQLFPEQHANRLQIRPNMPQDRLMDLYDECGIFVFPSLFEGFGKAPLEAMARGLCVVASNVGGMADIIENMKSGILVPPGDIRALKNAISKLVTNYEISLAISQEARTTALNYSWNRTGREISDWLKHLNANRSK